MVTITTARAICIGGTLAAALDLAFATAFAASNGLMPPALLRLIASGLLGQAASGGGAATAVVGFALHFILSYLWAALFVLAAPRFPALTVRPVAAGCAFGIFVFLAMRLVVKPLSAFPYPVNWKPLSSVLDLMSHMFLFGVPIALAAQRYGRAFRKT
jgi:uncharacterized membrane protein YagU involved in acid resistance